MAKKSRAAPKPRPQHAKTYLQAWLDYRNKTHEQLSAALDMSRPQVTRIVGGKRPYSQAFLEAAAEYLETDAASLLMRDPTQPDSIWSLWEHAKMGERQEIRDFAEYVVGRRKKQCPDGTFLLTAPCHGGTVAPSNWSGPHARYPRPHRPHSPLRLAL